MSSMSFASPEEPIDAVVLAGTRGGRAFDLDGRQVAKPYLTVGGEPLVRRVVRAVLGARRVGFVFVVGQQNALQQALEPLLFENSGRIRLIDEGEDILQNCYRAYFLNLLPARGFEAVKSPRVDAGQLRVYQKDHPECRRTPALFVTSDLPFLTSEAIDAFLQRAPDDAAAAVGLVDHRELERMRVVLGEQTTLDLWKLGAIPLRNASVRMNNLFLVRPFLADPAVYTLLETLYSHRWLLKQDGSVHFSNWWAIAKGIVSYSFRLRGRLRFWRGLFNFVPAVLALCLARLTSRVGRWLSWPFRLFLSRRDMEFVGSLMFGGKGCLTISRGPGPAIDIDVGEAYLSLIRNDEENFRRVARYLNEIGPGKVPVPRRPSARRGKDDLTPASEEQQAEQAHPEKH
jgi:molybdopterin-guanine dinucleotide biosynthesis protein A